MATPPTRLTIGLIVIGTGTPRSTTLTGLQVGDIVCATGGTGDNTETLSITTGGASTATVAAWTQQQLVAVALYGREYHWTTVVTGAGDLVVTGTRTAGSGNWSMSARPFRGSDGVGTSSKTNVASGAPSLALVTTADNSAIVVGSTDWNAVDGVSRAWRTVNGAGIVDEGYGFVTGATTNYSATHADAGAAGSKTVGLTAPTGQKYSIAATEIKGASAVVAAELTMAPFRGAY